MRRYFSFFQDIKSANNELFKDFYDEETNEKEQAYWCKLF
jgi:hypothetical protein